MGNPAQTKLTKTIDLAEPGNRAAQPVRMKLSAELRVFLCLSRASRQEAPIAALGASRAAEVGFPL